MLVFIKASSLRSLTCGLQNVRSVHMVVVGVGGLGVVYVVALKLKQETRKLRRVDLKDVNYFVVLEQNHP